MDFDSSSKFISSLAKFLQSLCNGYVDFNNGVEIIGHIYINVDTGKKIDYVLNEKVCKTDENSVTFISNSFHAQPAEKPKPPEKSPKPAEKGSSNLSQQEDGIVVLDEPESNNIGTIPLHQQFKAKNRPSKRSHNQTFASNHKQQSKFSRTESPFGTTNNTSLSSSSPLPANFLSSESSLSDLSSTQLPSASETNSAPVLNAGSIVFPQRPGDPPAGSITSHDQTEERDVTFKQEPGDVESDLSLIKQEYDATQHSGDNGYDECQGQTQSGYSAQFDPYYNEDSEGTQGYDPTGAGPSNEDFYQSGISGAIITNVKGGDTAGHDILQANTQADTPELRKLISSNVSNNTTHNPQALLTLGGGAAPAQWVPGKGCPVPGCRSDSLRVTDLRRHWREKHEEIVAKFYCASCPYVSKRRSNVTQHHKLKHGTLESAEYIGQIQYEPNNEFIDPHPLTLESLSELIGKPSTSGVMGKQSKTGLYLVFDG